MDSERRKIIGECLDLWKELSSIPDTYTIRTSRGFKQNILNRLGLGRKREGCPFCELYIFRYDCPIGDCTHNTPCYNTAFDMWDEEISNERCHSQEYAKEFYKYLEDLARKEGYYDDEDSEKHGCD